MSPLDDHERDLFNRGFTPPAEPYDIAQPFDASVLLDGFTGEEQQVPVDRATRFA